MSQVEVHYQLTKPEMVRMMRQQLLRTWHVYSILLSGILMIVVSIFLLEGWDGVSVRPLLGIIFLLVGLVEFLFCGIATYCRPDLGCRKSASIQDAHAIRFSVYGVQSLSIDAQSNARWDVYSETIERDDYYLLRRKTRQGLGTRRAYVIVPKRSFSSLTDELAFRTLVERYTPTRLGPPPEVDESASHNWLLTS